MRNRHLPGHLHVFSHCNDSRPLTVVKINGNDTAAFPLRFFERRANFIIHPHHLEPEPGVKLNKSETGKQNGEKQMTKIISTTANGLTD